MPFINKIIILQPLLEEYAIDAGSTVNKLSRETILDYATKSTSQTSLHPNQYELVLNPFFLMSC